MRFLPFAVGIIVATALFCDHAKAQNYPWCAVYDEGGPVYNCGFTTLDQCNATVSGIGGFCERNDWYKPPVGAPGQRVRRNANAHS
jgi:hypothetical protein